MELARDDGIQTLKALMRKQDLPLRAKDKRRVLSDMQNMEEPCLSQLLLMTKGVRFQENYASFYNHPMDFLVD